jgi:hypothetical protein
MGKVKDCDHEALNFQPSTGINAPLRDSEPRDYWHVTSTTLCELRDCELNIRNEKMVILVCVRLWY